MLKLLLPKLLLYLVVVVSIGIIARLINGRWEWTGVCIGGAGGMAYMVYHYWEVSRQRNRKTIQ